jgi:hypothetical protein
MHSPSSLGKNITSKKEKGITPRAHALHADHTHNHGVCSAIVFFLSFLGARKVRERERAAAAVGRDNVLTKAGGWKFANSGAHA